MADHLLSDGEVVVLLAVVDLELEAHKVRKDGSGARLRLDRFRFHAGDYADDGKARWRIR